VVFSFDPNEKSAAGVDNPEDVKTDVFLTPGKEIAYIIRFENLSSATAPAQEVTITDALPASLELSTFRLGGIGWGDIYASVPEGRDAYQWRVDLRSTLGFFVDVEASLDANTRQAKWTFRSINPQTGDLISDPLAGFLPPNDASGRGEGFVTFFIRPVEGAGDGTQISNQARIVFDLNAPIDTSPMVVAIDGMAPTSAVLPLPPVSPANILVRWAGNDGSGAGVAAYDVFISIDGGAYQLWLAQTGNTQAVYSGQVGHTYRFYTIAYDRLGHIQAVPGLIQTTFTSRAVYLPVLRR
jgi:uncharacterized repeat protein (TIGR01451 family)